LLAALAIACWGLSQIGDRSPRPTEYARQLEELIVEDEDGQTHVTGEVTHTGLGCDSGEQNCHFVIKFQGLSIYVFYLLSLTGEDCTNHGAVRVAETLRNGDPVEVFGKYFDTGSISTCDSPDYFIRRAQ
jgi:hypothetical protein